MGTPMFMAPEQALGKIDELDGRTDIYALGAILYNILTLRPPIQGKTVNQVLLNVAKGDITPPSALNESSTSASRAGSPASPRARSDRKGATARDLQRRAMEASRKARQGKGQEAVAFPHCPGSRIPSALSAVAMKALATEQSDRYQAVKELQTDIEAYQGGFATSAEEAGTLRQVVLMMKRHKAEVMLLAAALVVLVAVVAGFVLKVMAGEKRALLAKEEALAAKTQAEGSERKATAANERMVRVSKHAAPEFVAKARQLMGIKEWGEALKAASMAVELDGSRHDAWFLKGLLELSSKDFAAAEKSFEQLGGMVNPGSRLHEQATTYGKLAVMCGRYVAKHGDAQDERLNQALAKAMATLEETLVAARFYGESKVSAGQEQQMLRVKLAAAVEGLVRNNTGLKEQDVEYGVSEEMGAHLRCRSKALFDITPLKGVPFIQLGFPGTQVRDIEALRGMPLVHLDLTHTQVSDIAALAGMRLEILKLNGTKVSDISVLKGMPLAHLDINGAGVRDVSLLRDMPLVTVGLGNLGLRDISVLRGKRLTSLSLYYNPVSDISVLEGMPLHDLAAEHTKIRDLSPLENTPLTCLRLGGAPVSDITVLRGLPLKTLYLWGSLQIHDLTPLADCRQLEELTIPEHCQDIEFLRELPNLRILDRCFISEARTAAEFWQSWDEQKVADKLHAALKKDNPEYNGEGKFVFEGGKIVEANFREAKLDSIQALRGLELRVLMLYQARMTDISPLKGMPLRELELQLCESVADITALAGMPLTALNLFSTQVRDISVLKGMPLSRLSSGNTPIEDISALAGMPLDELMIGRTQVRDLSALEGLRLTRMSLEDNVRITDISALRGMPLKHLGLHACDALNDLSPLADCRQLERLTIPKHCTEIECLRGLPNLKVLDNATWLARATQAPAEFWRKWDAAKAKQGAR